MLSLAVISLDTTAIMLICVHDTTVYDQQVSATVSSHIRRIPANRIPNVISPSKRGRSPIESTNGTRVTSGLYPYPFRSVLEPKNGCGEGGRLPLVAYVHSAAANFGRRAVVRRTWANTSLYGGAGVKVFFFVALPERSGHQVALEAEALRHDDVIQLGFVEHYRNMTYKAMGAIDWLLTRCAGAATYFLKTDDDTFVNSFALFRHVADLAAVGGRRYGSGLLACSRGHVKTVYRSGKWAVSRAEYPEDYYPPYCSGMAYLMTVDVARAVRSASARVPYFWIDDVYVTGLLPEALRLQIVDMRQAFVLDVDKIDELFAGDEWYKFAFCHMPDPEHFQRLWRVVRRKASQQSIPEVEHVVPGKLADNYTYHYAADRPYYYVPPLLDG